MSNMAETLVEHEPFEGFALDCQECGKNIVEQDDLMEGAFKNQLLIEQSLRRHAKRTGHTNISGSMNPMGVLEKIEVSINVS